MLVAAEASSISLPLSYALMDLLENSIAAKPIGHTQHKQLNIDKPRKLSGRSVCCCVLGVTVMDPSSTLDPEALPES